MTNTVTAPFLILLSWFRAQLVPFMFIDHFWSTAISETKELRLLLNRIVTSGLL